MISRCYSLIALSLFTVSAHAMENTPKGPITTTTEMAAFPSTNNINWDDAGLTVESTLLLEQNSQYCSQINSRYCRDIMQALQSTKVDYVIEKRQGEESTCKTVLKLALLESVIGKQAVEKAKPHIRQHTLANLPFYRRHAGKCYLGTFALGIAAGLSVPFWLPELLKKLDVSEN